MDKKQVPHEVLLKFFKFWTHVWDCVRKGSLDPTAVISAVQNVITRGGQHLTQTFMVSVNYEDSRYRVPLPKSQKGLYFPIRGKGRATVIMAYLVLNQRSTKSLIMNGLAAKGWRLPDRAEAESFLDQYPDEPLKHDICGVCGPADSHGIALDFASCVWADRDGRGLTLHALDTLGSHWCILAVCEVIPEAV